MFRLIKSLEVERGVREEPEVGESRLDDGSSLLPSETAVGEVVVGEGAGRLRVIKRGRRSSTSVRSRKRKVASRPRRKRQTKKRAPSRRRRRATTKRPARKTRAKVFRSPLLISRCLFKKRSGIKKTRRVSKKGRGVSFPGSIF